MKNAVIAALVSALVSASAGAAATKYVITSTSQIKPTVLRKLEKPALAATPAAAPGPQGERGPEGKQGATGLTGPQGPGGESVRGPMGEAGPEGASGSAYRQIRAYDATSAPLAPGEHRAEGIEARCPEGSRPVGGGYEASEPRIHVYGSHVATNEGWTVAAVNESATNSGTVTVTVLCAE